MVGDPPSSCGTSEDEVFGYLVKKKKMLDGVCITGGEPTIWKDLPEFIVELKKLGYFVKLDTNGSNPAMLEKLYKNKLLDYVAMDLKAPWTRYSEIGIFGASELRSFGASELMKLVENCRKSFELIQNSGVDHEFRTTVFPQKHVENDFMEMASYLKSGEKYYLQNIRYIKNLDPALDQSKKINVSLVVKNLKQKYPDLIVEER